MSEMRVTGHAFLLADSSGNLIDDIDTDMIFHNRWLHITDPSEMAQYALGNLEGYENFAARVKPGSWVVAGRNFGAGSSRQQAVDCFKALGCAGIVAVSVAPIYLRNAINAGLPIAQVPDLVRKVESGDELELDLVDGVIKNVRSKQILTPSPGISRVQVEIYQAGGLLNI